MTERKITKTELDDEIRVGGVTDCTVEEMNCRGLEWGGIPIRNSIFENVHMGSADFRKSVWERVSFRNVILRGATGPEQLQGCTFEGVDLVESVWDGGRSEGTSWRQSNLANASFDGASLVRCDFHGTDLARISGKEMSWLGGGAANDALGGPNMMGADLSGALICAISLRGANLCGANLEGSLFLGVDLTGAELSGASLDGAVWVGCRTEGIQVASDGHIPWKAMDSLAMALKATGETRLVDLVTYLISSGALLTTGGAVRSGVGLPVPPEYFGAGFQEILETLRMRLPHPEWGNTPTPEVASPRETNGSPDASTETAKGEGKDVPEVSREMTSEEPPADGGRFSLLEID